MVLTFESVSDFIKTGNDLSHHSLISKTNKSVLSNYHMVEHWNFEHPARFAQAFCELDIRLTGLQVTARVIMAQDDRGCFHVECSLENQLGIDHCSRHSAFAYLLTAEDMICAV